MAILVTGCVTVTEPSPSRTDRTGAKLAADDPCANQLHDLCGYLLQYWLVEHKLPPDLASLSVVADPDKPVPLKCPVSNLPYVYVRDGLVALGDPRELLIFDAQPSHNGMRQGIVASEPDPSMSRPLSFWVVQIPEKAFRLYHAKHAAAGAGS